MADKVKFGLSNVHIFPIKPDGSYDAVIKVAGAVNFSMDAQGDTSDFYADNMIYYTSVANNGYSGDLEVANIPDEVWEKIFNMEKDDNGVFVEDSTKEVVPFALLFEQAGDVKGTKFCLYNCKATRPSRSLSTTTETKEPQTFTMSVKATPLTDGKVIAMTSDTTDAQVITDWYTAPYEG